MKSAIIANIPGTYTILYLPEIGSQLPCGGGGAGVVVCGPCPGTHAGIGQSGTGQMLLLSGDGAGVPCGVCVPLTGARPH